MSENRPFLFENWGKNLRFSAPRCIQPENESELAEAVTSSEKIRIVGAGHSWSALCETEETLINLDRMDRILEVDKNKGTIRVQAGIRLRMLNRELDKKGLAMINLGSYDQQSLAGALSTCTHGSGTDYPILASAVEKYRLMKADGRCIEITEKDDIFPFAICGLGLFGIITEITLKVVPAFRLADETQAWPFDEALRHTETWKKEFDHFKMWWVPHTDRLIVLKHKRTDSPEAYSPISDWFRLRFMSEYMYRILLILGHLSHDLRPRLNKLMIGNYSRQLKRIRKSFKVFLVPEPPIHRETEWAFPAGDAERLIREFRELAARGNHKINFIQEIRFSKADGFPISPSYGRNSVWIGCYLIGDKGWNELFIDFENWARKNGGRAHWGKEFTPDPEYLKRQFPRWDEFAKRRKEYDPTGKFLNRLTRSILC